MKDAYFKGEDGRFYYLDWGGDGPLAHISHATGFCARTYTPWARRLTGHLRVLGMDDRGHGLTEAPADPKKIRDWGLFARDLEIFFQSFDQPLVAIGHSRGAVAGMILAVRRPDLVRALVLIDPTILPLSWMWWWYLAKKTGLSGRVPIAARAAKRRAVWPDSETALNSYRGRGAFRNWREGFLEGYIDGGFTGDGNGRVRLACDPAWEAASFTACNHDAWHFVRRITQPVLVLYGRKSDTFLPAAARRFNRLLPRATMVGLEGVGHFVPMERPEESAEIVLDFLRKSKVIT